MPVRRSPNHIPAEDPKQGIVTILAADAAKPGGGSIRRTLSADMSSKKWLQHNGFFSSPIKKIVSSHQIADTADDDSGDEELLKLKSDRSQNQDEVWRSIQSEKARIGTDDRGGAWGLLLTQKSDSCLLQTPTPAPYVHPMVKRSQSGLSEKSLEVCTESLGSETGSDCFSSCASDDDEEEVQSQSQSQSQKQGEMQVDEDPFGDLQVPKYKESAAAGKPFPPPLPSIGGAALHMHSRREDGRLVVEAVAVAPRKYFHARRSDGRLLLTLTHPPPESEHEHEHEREREREHEKTGPESENPLHRSVTKTRLGAKKMMAVGNINPKWANEEPAAPAPAQALPPRPPATRAAPPVAVAFNAYEYFWRSKPGFMMSNKNSKMNQDLVMYMRGCKEARRSLIWEPYCIATS